MALDVLPWLVVRTDLTGAALSMVVKESIATVGAPCDWLTKEATRGHGSRRSYTHRTQALVDLDQISMDLKVELDWVWQVRCNVHMHEVTSLEYDMYSREDYNRAARAKASLVIGLLASLYCLAAGLFLLTDWQDPFATADPGQLARASGTHGGKGGIVVLAIRFWPYVLIGLGGYFAYNSFAILRMMPKGRRRA